MKPISAAFPVSLLLGFIACAGASLIAQSTQANPAPASPQYTFKANVNRVLVDVVVTDAHGQPVHGLTKNDFTVQEDGQPQTVLSFDAFNFDQGMDYLPPAKLPPLPPDTFVNLPTTPERGPLYVLFYDLVNIPPDDQIPARAQLIRFIQNKPAGARFAIFVSSDGVHLVEGFTSDTTQMLAAVDRNGKRRHVPKVFLMGVNFGRGDQLAAAARLSGIAQYLAPIPGRKNIIWFASEFPLSLFPSPDGADAYVNEAKQTINLLAKNQIAIYPVDTSALPIAETYATPGSVGGAGITTDDRDTGVHFPNIASGPKPGVAGNPIGTFKGPGVSLTESSYMTQDQIAEMTGGRAVYSTNNLTGALEKVTEIAGNYYTLSYSPSDKNLDGSLRHIKVRLQRDGGYHLAYRRAYYATRTPDADVSTDDSITAAMKHGAPEDHQLIFGVHVAASPKSGKQQLYTLGYTVMAHQLRAVGDATPEFEIAAAVFDADGQMQNSTLNRAVEAGEPPGKTPQTKFRMEQQLDAPLDAKFLRVAVRHIPTGKTGAMEIPLPLASKR
ncbi:MAG: VWA domain-containing protein [Acidobacteriaceae bacterium]